MTKHHVKELTRRTWALSVALIGLLGCTVYTPVQGLDVAPGQSIRVILSPTGAVTLAPKIGARASRLEGTLRTLSDSSIVMALQTVNRESGINDTYGGADITLARPDFESVEQIKTSRPRSILTAGALAAAAFLVARGAGDISGGKSGSPAPPGK